MSIIRRQDAVAGIATPQNKAFAPKRIFAATNMASMSVCMTNKGHVVSDVTATTFISDGVTIKKDDMDKCNFSPYGVQATDLMDCSHDQGGCL